MKPAQRLAQFVFKLTYSSLPPEVSKAGMRHLLDTVGVGILGSESAMPRAAFEGIQKLPSIGSAAVWGRKERMVAPYAAMANGISAHVLDYDDTHSEGIVHGSACIAPVVLALGEAEDVGGKGMLEAFVAGWEVAARVGLAAKGTMHQRGFHTTSVAGVFGAAAAAAKLLKLDVTKTGHAIAISGSLAAGINEYQSDGSSSKIVHTGWTAYSGIVAAELARAGMTGPASVFEGRLGFLNAYGDLSRSDPSRLTRGLDQEWEVTRISIKPYPCCHFGHAFIDCAAALRKKGVRAADVESIECVVPEIEVAMVCEPLAEKRAPTSPYGAKFSLPFMVALGLVDGEVSGSSFTQESIARRDLLDLANRVTYRIAGPNETTFPKYFPGWVNVTLRNGETRSEKMDVNRGTPEQPLDDESLSRKFVQNLHAAAPQLARELADAFLDLPNQTARSIAAAIQRLA
jgi:2-methylcitrate dehydratase PrpD